MKEIRLTQGKSTIVDDADYPYLSQFKWHYCYGYALRYDKDHYAKTGVSKNIFMHRELVNTPEGLKTDHINGDKLDNRKENLRICNSAQNAANKLTTKHKSTSSKYRGVMLPKGRRKWESYIYSKRKRTRLGFFETEEEAALSYNLAAKKIFGDFANFNKLPCSRLDVTAASINKNGEILSEARNHHIFDECNGKEGDCGAIHAEEALVDKLTVKEKSGVEEVRLSHSPCLRCAKLLYVALPRLRRVMYWDEYRKTDGIEYLRRMGIEVRRMDIESATTI
ncbi:HNH endonuclease [Salibacterium lacus]|uniref:HNH endonuclease n=1 Tax=Salibacterium lacus TaxID=1898109 RepID=A0ABW5SY32_9BACI